MIKADIGATGPKEIRSKGSNGTCREGVKAPFADHERRRQKELETWTFSDDTTAPVTVTTS